VGNYYENEKKGRGIRLFKNFIVENRVIFGIRNTALFSYQEKENNEGVGQKKYNSFSEVSGGEKNDKNIEKNYVQAKNNI
jgi:hypothetical protein